MDTKIRLAIFNWLNQQISIHGNVLTSSLLKSGFMFRGEPVFLVGSKGIWKPKQLKYPITITSDPNGIYDDGFISDSLLKYSYEGTNPNLWTNEGLRKCMNRKIPLVYLHKISKGKYYVHLPVFIVADNPNKLYFTVAAEQEIKLATQENLSQDYKEPYLHRQYVTREVKQRMHQQTFRELVLDAYKDHCAVCRLKHRELLDAAHIIPDSSEFGLPIVQNGLSLCKIHHAAFDHNIIGISPDFMIHVREDILEEIDGPMLKYGIQEMNGIKLELPRSKTLYPDQERLEVRFKNFKNAI